MNLKQLTKQELIQLTEDLGLKAYRTGQIINWIYKKHAVSIDGMTDLSKELREELKKSFYISSLALHKTQLSKDGTRKFLFVLDDGNTIESVLIPNNKGGERYTLCISSQAGCALGCKFCTTGSLGFIRNLRAWEIVDQVISAERFLTPPEGSTLSSGNTPSVTNIVFMGMGEPFNNFMNVIHALEKLTGLMGFSKRKITVSTAGIVPGISEFAKKAQGINLAVSLNASTDDIRDRIMPINRKYPLYTLMKACRDFSLPPNRRITFEYVMLGGLNDSEKDARRLAGLLKGIRSKVNLIQFNPAPDQVDLMPPSEKSVLTFQNVLLKAGITTVIRKSMGRDISAACGQLKAAYQKKHTPNFKS